MAQGKTFEVYPDYSEFLEDAPKNMHWQQPIISWKKSLSSDYNKDMYVEAITPHTFDKRKQDQSIMTPMFKDKDGIYVVKDK